MFPFRFERVFSFLYLRQQKKYLQMITTNELRQGNLVKHTGEGQALQRLKVIEVRRNTLLTIDLNGLVFGIGIEDAEGIPLTPEIFAATPFKHHTQRPGYFFNRVKLFKPSEAGGNYLVSLSGAGILRPVTFLHQLQNFYFSLYEEDFQITF